MALRRIGAAARTEKISNLPTSFQNLAVAATTLNKESDKFTSAISSLDEALNKLSPGVIAWVTISQYQHEDEPLLDEERLGFAKTNNRWGLSLSRLTIDVNNGDCEKEDAWLFNDAPRSLRLRAIDHFPDLVAELTKEAERVTKEVSAGAEIASELLQSVNSAIAAKEKQR